MNTAGLDADFRLLAENVPGCFALVSADETIVLVNTRYADMLGKERAEIEGRTLREILDEVAYTRAEARFRKALLGESAEYEVAGRLPDGRRMWLRISDVPHFDSEGNIDGFYVFATDISAHHEAQEQFRRQGEALSYAQRRSTVGELATAWAHDITQPLHAITNFMQAAALRIRAGNVDRAKLQELLTQTAGEVRRAANTVQQVRGLESDEELGPTPVDLRSIVRGAVEVVRTLVDSPGLRIELDLGADDLSIRCDPFRTQQICMDLLQNALDAMGAENATGTIYVRAKRGDDGFNEIIIQDEGSGIEPGQERRVFESFFTTKEGGLGLGLPISKRSTEALGGTLSLASRTDGSPGAEARLRLPSEG